VVALVVVVPAWAAAQRAAASCPASTAAATASAAAGHSVDAHASHDAWAEVLATHARAHRWPWTVAGEVSRRAYV
jgi:hypothetical protein